MNRRPVNTERAAVRIGRASAEATTDTITEHIIAPTTDIAPQRLSPAHPTELEAPTLPGLELSTVPLDEYTQYRDPWAGVRQTDPHTSRAAAPIAAPKLSTLMAGILELLRARGPLTGDQLVALYREYSAIDPERYPLRSPQRITTARGELVRLGRVRYTGADGVSDLGNAAQLWEAT